MKLYHIRNVDKFFDLIRNARGSVFLVSPEGDKLNLKSSFCKYFAFAEIFAGNEIPECELQLSDPEDNLDMLNFMLSDMGKKEEE